MYRTGNRMVRYFKELISGQQPQKVEEECKFRIMEHIAELNPPTTSKRELTNIDLVYRKKCKVLTDYDIVVVDFVVDDIDYRSLHFYNEQSTYNCTVQSLVKRNSPSASIELEYLRGLSYAIPITYVANNNSFENVNALVLGCGAGVIPSILSNISDIGIIDTLEIEPEVIYCAKQYFGYKESCKRIVINTDAVKYVKSASKEYSIVFLDAYENSELPESISSDLTSFLLTIQSSLSLNGIVAGNIIHYTSEDFNSELLKWKSVFPHVVLLHISNNQSLIFASTSKIFKDNSDCKHRIQQAVQVITQNEEVPLSDQLIHNFEVIS